MLNCSLRGMLGGRQIAPITSWCSMRCFSTPQSKGRKRQRVWSTEAADSNCWSWTQRQTYLPSSWWSPRLVERRLSPFSMRCINSGGYQGLHPESQNLWQRWCPPWKTVRGGNEGKHHRWQRDPFQTDIWPPRSRTPWGGWMPPGKEVSPRWEKPTIGTWLWQLPWKRR